MSPLENLEVWLQENKVNYWREEFDDGSEIHLLPEGDRHRGMFNLLFDRNGDVYMTGVSDYETKPKS